LTLHSKEYVSNSVYKNIEIRALKRVPEKFNVDEGQYVKEGQLLFKNIAYGL
jgi:multidrug efflux pump subunit AcrA (membrane-fusion protein)